MHICSYYPQIPSSPFFVWMNQTEENEPTEFLITMHDEIQRCLKCYNRTFYVNFRAKVKSLPDDISYTQIDAHNSHLFMKIHQLSDKRTILRTLLFLVYSPNLPISDLFHSLFKISLRLHPDMFFYKVITIIHSFMTRDPQLLQQFSKKLTPETAKWPHFVAIGTLISQLPPNDLASVIKAFQSVSLSFKPCEFRAVSRFITGMKPTIFDAFMQPFLDRQILRNTETFLKKMPFYLKPLEFGRCQSIPHHGRDFIESISQACESSNEKVSLQAQKVVNLISNTISPKIFPFNSKSIPPYFQAITICQTSVTVAFQLLKSQPPIQPPAQYSILSFLTRAVNDNQQYFDVNQFVQNYLMNPPQFILLILIMNSPVFDTSILKGISATPYQSNNKLYQIMKYKLKEYKLKESDISSIYIPHSFKQYSEEEVRVYSQLLYDVSADFPLFASKSFVLCSISTRFQRIILHYFDLSLSKNSEEFNTGLFQIIQTRNPKELTIFIDLITKYALNFNTAQFVYCLVLNNELSVDHFTSTKDRQTIVSGLFNLLQGDWGQHAEKAFNKLCANSDMHTIIAETIEGMLDQVPQLYKIQTILTSLMKYFDITTDRKIFETIFFSEPQMTHLISYLLKHLPHYRQFPTLMASLLNTKGEGFSREFTFSMIPKHDITCFDFLLFLPFYRSLLEVNTFDYICEKISDLLCQFDWISFPKSDIIDEIEDFEEANQVLAHLYASDKLNDITDDRIANRIIKRNGFAELFQQEIAKYGNLFYTPVIVSAFTVHNIYVEPIPIFQRYLNYMINFGLNNENIAVIVGQTVSRNYQDKINDVVDAILSLTNKNSNELILSIFAEIQDIGDNTEKVFNFVMSLKKSQIKPEECFNRIVIKFLVFRYADQIIDRFFSQPSFTSMPFETVSSLSNSFIHSKRKASELFEMIKSQCKPKITDATVNILISCLQILKSKDSQTIIKISNDILNDYQNTKGEYLGLVFHFSNIQNKVELLTRWITSNEMRSKALIVLRYLFTIPSETTHLHRLLDHLNELTTSSDMKIVENATNALRLAASTLSEDAAEKIAPMIISTIKPEISRLAFEADIQFLTQVEQKNALILLPFLPDLFNKLISSNQTNIYDLCQTLRQHLLNAKKPMLYVDLVELIQNHSSPIEIYTKIDEKIEETRTDETLTIIAFTLIEKDLTNIEINLKLQAFKILSELDLPQLYFDKAMSIFYKLSTDPSRNEILIHFRNFLNSCTFERKEQIFQYFINQLDHDIKNFQAGGFSVLFGSILAKLNDDEHVSMIIEKIKKVENGMIQESLMTSLVEMLEVNPNLVNRHIIDICKCFLEITDSNLSSFNLLKRMISFITKENLYDILHLISNFMHWSVSEVRETCLNLLFIIMRTQHPFESLLTDIQKVVFEKVFIATICNFYDYEQGIREKSEHLLSLLSNYLNTNNVLIDDSLPHLSPFLISDCFRINILAIYAIVHLFVNMNIPVIKLMSFWIQTSNKQWADQIICGFENIFPVYLRPEFAKAIINLPDNISVNVNQKISYLLLNCFIDSRIYLTLIPTAYQKWQTQTSSFINDILNDLFLLAHGQLTDEPKIKSNAKLTNLPSRFRFGEKLHKTETRTEKETEMIKKASIDTFINLAICLSNERVIDYIKEFKNSLSNERIVDQVIIQLIVKMANEKPDFFLHNAEVFADCVFPIFFKETSTSDIYCIEQSILLIVQKLLPMEVANFFRKVSPVFLSFNQKYLYRSTLRSILSDQFVNDLISTVFKKSGKTFEMYPDFACFLSSIFKYTSDEIRRNNAELIIKKFIAAVIQNVNESSSVYNSADLICCMRLFSTFILNNSDILILSEIGVCLSISQMTHAIHCEFLSLIEVSMSMSINNLLILNLLIEKVSNLCDNSIFSPVPTILDSISYLIEFSEPKFDKSILATVWKTTSHFLHSDNVQIQITTSKLAAKIVNQIADKNKCSPIMNEILANNHTNVNIFSSFLTHLERFEFLHPDHVEYFIHFLSIANPNQCIFLNLIPKINNSPLNLTQQQSKSLLVESLNFLVRGVKGRNDKESGIPSPFVVPLFCLNTIRRLQSQLKEIDIKESSVIITGFYLASCGLNLNLKEIAFRILNEILGNTQDTSFRDKYFQTIDSSLVQAFKRDILYLSTSESISCI